MSVKLRQAPDGREGDGPSSPAPRPITLTPLAVSGVVVSKAALIEALRVYVPALVDLEVVEDGERFVLDLASPDEPAMSG